MNDRLSVQEGRETDVRDLPMQWINQPERADPSFTVGRRPDPPDGSGRIKNQRPPTTATEPVSCQHATVPPPAEPAFVRGRSRVVPLEHRHRSELRDSGVG
jgi:hypothetical protein